MSRRPFHFFLSAVVASAVLAQQPFTERIEVSAIDIPIVVRDANGKTPPDLKPSDFILTEDGIEQEIIGLSYPGGGQAPSPVPSSAMPTTTGEAPVVQKPWQIVIFLQQSLSSSHGLKTALEGVSAHADELTALGPVEVVGDAGGTPKRLIAPTSDGKQLRDALQALASKIRGSDEIIRLRTEYLATVGPSGGNANLAVATARIESTIIRSRQNALVNWLSRYGAADHPRALVFLTNGFDTEPRDFYNVSDPAAILQMEGLSSGPLQREISQAIAAAGWTALSFAPGWMESAQSPTFDVSNSGHGRLNAFKSGQNMDSITAVSVNMHPIDPLKTMADATGGSVLTNPRKLGGEISSLGDRLVLTYQLHRRRDGKVHKIDVKSRRPGLTVRAQDYVVTGTPEAFAVARASSLATLGGDQGELPVRCSFQSSETKNDEVTSEVEVIVDLSPIDAIRASLTNATLRFSIAVQTPDAPPVTVSKRLDNIDLSKERGWRVTFQVRHRPGARAGVVAEEVATGAWGGCTCDHKVGAGAQVANAQPMGWPNVPNASAIARSNGRLMLLYVRTGNARVDQPAEEWLAEASREGSVAFGMKQYVLASATQGVLVKTAEETKPHVLVMDGWGGSIVDLETAFHSPKEFGRDLIALAQLTPRFNQAALARNSGDVTNATIARGQALIDAGFDAAGREDLELAITTGLATADEGAVRRARIGIASIDLKDGKTEAALSMLKTLLSEHGLEPDVAASAWMLRGHAYRSQRKTSAAIEAYQQAYDVMPKPSPLAEAARRFLESLGSAPKNETQTPAAPGTVRILYPHRVSLTGSVDFAAVAPTDTARVEYFLDDARVAEENRAPFRTTLGLGSTPRVHTVRAVAYSNADVPLGESSVTVNEVVSGVDVTIVQPSSNEVKSKATIEVEARAPEGRKVTAVDLFWNEQKLTTLVSAPYRYELTLPSPSAQGYIRAIARDDSGATAEDVHLINYEGAAEEMRVDAVQLFAIVQDRDGRGVEGLTDRDFLVQEEGVPVDAKIQSSADDPISIGLALDTSSSMHTIITDVIDYGQRFVKEAMREGDKSFLVEFDQEPRLIQPLTESRDSLANAIYGVRAAGATALWDAIVFSLRHFQGVPGKRALVVFTDGDNTEGTVKPNVAIQYAQEVGIPVYIVEMFAGLTQTTGMNHRNMEANLRDLATASGGQFFRYMRNKDLPRVFEQIRDNTRGEYLLTYVSPKSGAGLRKVSVSVKKKNVTVRAPSAYYMSGARRP